MKGKLTTKQQRFVDEYLIDGNATQAAKRAGYSDDTAYSQGQRLLKNVVVAKVVAKAQAERSERTKIDADYVLKRLQEMDSLDVLDILDCAGNIKPIKDWPKSWRTSISGIDLHEMINGDTNTIVRKIKWPDKAKNLELLGRHVNIQAWKDKIENQNLNLDAPIPVDASPEDAAKAYQDLIKNL